MEHQTTLCNQYWSWLTPDGMESVGAVCVAPLGHAGDHEWRDEWAKL